MSKREVVALPDPAARRTAVAEDVSVHIGKIEIVHGVDMTVEPGEIVALVGPNGCGKSTLLSALSGLRPIAGGRIHYGDSSIGDLGHLELSRMRALVAQSQRADAPFTVQEIVEMGRHPWLRTDHAAESAAVVAKAIEDCDLGNLTDRALSQLSIGQQARVAIARALAQNTPILFLDEPTAALDIRHQEHVLGILRQRRDEGAAILIVVHDLSLAAGYADRAALMSAGRIVKIGATDEVLTEDLLTDVYRHPVVSLRHPETGQRIIMPRR
ncbi:ABC transporter ATP-binding protein [Jongsikchunia kroppenstedtii]|uniref:ABC transporter ATP-binding protein n=1 Tax=Jongsikchunia kroppenstedtii TaxID=1121721 RepID=UPI0003A1623C|nr:ABC transporter ATP-binding protein [Jongsikchunia kroppenstedtii]